MTTTRAGPTCWLWPGLIHAKRMHSANRARGPLGSTHPQGSVYVTGCCSKCMKYLPHVHHRSVTEQKSAGRTPRFLSFLQLATMFAPTLSSNHTWLRLTIPCFGRPHLCQSSRNLSACRGYHCIGLELCLLGMPSDRLGSQQENGLKNTSNKLAWPRRACFRLCCRSTRSCEKFHPTVRITAHHESRTLNHVQPCTTVYSHVPVGETRSNRQASRLIMHKRVMRSSRGVHVVFTDADTPAPVSSIWQWRSSPRNC